METIFKGKYLEVIKEGIYEIVKPPDAVAIICIDKNRKVKMVEQYREPVRKRMIEIPAGLIDEGETELVAAKRELREECGIEARAWTYLGEFYHAMGYSTGKTTLFLAEDLTDLGYQTLDDTEDIKICDIDFDILLSFIKNNIIIDVKTLLAIYKLKELGVQNECDI